MTRTLLNSWITILAIGMNQIQARSQTISELKFLNEFVVPYNTSFKQTTIGGLSGIDYDKEHDLYYLLSDDRSDINPVRFYTAKIRMSEKGIDTVYFSDVHFLLQPNGKNYPSFKLHPERSVDPEDIRFNSKTHELYWTSEGERILTAKKPVLIKTSIVTSKDNGAYVSSFPLPPLTSANAFEKGVRRNGALESIAFTKDFSTLFTALEEPLYEDGPPADVEKTDSWSRIFRFDVKSKTNTAQYAYLLEPVAFQADPKSSFKINGISEILTLDNGQILTVERSYSTGRLPCTIKIFVADLSSADDIKGVSSLKEQPPGHPVPKKLLLNMDDLGIHIDNVEGATFGPKLSNGHATLIFVTDDNFQQKQKTQFLAFEVIP
jgi:hypothetical protein